MKKMKVLMLVMFFVVTLISSPGLFSEEKIVKSVKKSDSKVNSVATYTCPMASCKTFSHKPGKCSKCGMDLKKIDKKDCCGKKNLKKCDTKKAHKKCEGKKKAHKKCEGKKKTHKKCCGK